MTEMEQKIARAKELAEINILREEVERLTEIVSLIYDGIKAGAQVPLFYPDGSTVLITKAKPRRQNGE